MIPPAFWVVFRAYVLSDLSWKALFIFYRTALWVGGSIYFLFALAWITLLKRGVFQSRYALYILILIELGYETMSAMMVRDLNRMGLGLGLVLIMTWVYRWLEQRVKTAHLNPGVKWYEGLPRLLPRVSARVKIKDQEYRAQVRSLDHEGIFLFIEECKREDWKSLRMKNIEFSLIFRTRQLEGEGRLTSLFMEQDRDEMPGIGLQFSPKDLYHFNQYTALVEELRGEGILE